MWVRVIIPVVSTAANRQRPTLNARVTGLRDGRDELHKKEKKKTKKSEHNLLCPVVIGFGLAGEYFHVVLDAARVGDARRSAVLQNDRCRRVLGDFETERHGVTAEFSHQTVLRQTRRYQKNMVVGGGGVGKHGAIQCYCANIHYTYIISSSLLLILLLSC